MTTTEGVEVLVKARTLVGRSYKARVWRAWFNGRYDAEGLESISTELQQLRNSLGPKFLAAARLPAPSPVTP